MTHVTHGFNEYYRALNIPDPSPLAAATDYAGDLAQSPREVRETVPVRVGWWERLCQRVWG